MANWKFTDDYGKTYPSLQESILSMLVFSDHTINGNAFSGVLSVEATGAALKILGPLLGVNSIAVSGTVVTDADSINVTLRSTDDNLFTQAIAKAIPLIGGSITKNAWMNIHTIATTKDPEGEPPATDEFSLNVTIAIGRGTVTITSSIPMSKGFFFLSGDFEGFGITLEDLNFLMGKLAGGNAWFPTSELGPYSAGQTSFGLLSMSLMCYVTLNPINITITSFDVAVGISKLPVRGKALYLDPLGVWVTISDPLSEEPSASWGLMGTMKLLNFANPGPEGLSNPDFIFDFSMSFPTSTNKVFSMSAALENPSKKPVNVMLQDLLGEGKTAGLSDKIIVNSFELETSADTSTGTITDFSTSVVMSGGFGLFEKITVEEMSISVVYSGD